MKKINKSAAQGSRRVNLMFKQASLNAFTSDFDVCDKEAFPELIFDNTPIKFVEDHKHLGITFSQNGQWHTHIEQIANTASKILGMMMMMSWSLTTHQPFWVISVIKVR